MRASTVSSRSSNESEEYRDERRNNVKSKTSITTPSDTEIRIEREFDAPRELVWEAYTEADSMAEWLGPHSSSMTVDELDLRVGGSYQWTAPPEGRRGVLFFGEFRVVEEPEVLESTFTWKGSGYPPSIDRVEFIDLDGNRTRIVVTSTFESKELRDGMLESGMEGGVKDGYEKLDAILARRQGS